MSDFREGESFASSQTVEEYGKGNDGRAQEYLDKAANCYDKALDMIG